MNISFEKSFGYVFKDQDWVVKLLIATVFLLLTPVMIGIPFTTGYVIRIIRYRLEGKEGLPAWTDLGGMFVDGIKMVFVGFVYALPIFLMAIGLVILMVIVGKIDNDAGALVGLLVFPFQGLSMLYSLAIVLVHPHIYHVIATDAPLRQAFQLKGYFKILKTEWSAILVALLFIWLAGLVAGFGIFIFLIGLFIGLAYVNMVTGDVYGRLLQDWKTRGLI